MPKTGTEIKINLNDFNISNVISIQILTINPNENIILGNVKKIKFV